MARHASTRGGDRPARSRLSRSSSSRSLAAATTFVVLETSATSTPRRTISRRRLAPRPSTTSTAPTTTTTTTRPAGPGFNVGQVTAVGDSVMLDYQDPLQTSIPGINVNAAVSRQWSDGESILQSSRRTASSART